MTRILLKMLLAATVGLPLFLAVVPASAQAPTSQSAEVTRQRLASVLARYANEIMVSDDLNVAGLNVALTLLEESTRLDPESVETWRKLISLAIAIDREDLLEHATHQLLKQVPDDQQAQLSRLMAALDRFNTADERMNALEQLLAKDNADLLGPEISARLAFRLADLHRRRGDLQAFGRWLGESIMLDPTYSDAVGVATGFLRDQVPDRVAYVELLLGLLTADLTDDAILESLNIILLDGGAYEQAERMIHMRMKQLYARGLPAGSSLYQQLAIAQWGQGNRDRALQTIADRRELLNVVYESLARSEDPSKSPLELAQLKAPLPPQLAAIQAMLLSNAEDSQRDESLEDLVLSVDFEQGLSDMAAEQGRERAERLLHAYWLLLWLDADKDLLSTRLDEILAIEELSDAAMERITAWQLLRSGDAAAAEEVFRKDPSGHMLTQAGLAKSLIAQGQKRDAAEVLLPMWKIGKNRAEGLWARDQLEELLGRKIPNSEEAIRMGALVDQIPKLLDRVPEDPRLALSMRIRPVEESFKPYDPILIEFEISNNSPLPFAIDRDGPIRNLVLLEADVEVPYEQTPMGPGIVFEIESRLRLMPFESVTVTIDLRRYWVGTIINRHPLYGASIDLTGILNFRVMTGPTTGRPSYMPGLMGIETDSNDIRVDGQRITTAWASRVIEDLKGEQIGAADLVNMALLTHVLSSNTGSLVSEPLADEVVNAGVDAIINVYPRLDPVSRAWILAVMEHSPRLEPIWEMARRSDDVTVHLIELIRLQEAARYAGSIEPLLDDATLISATNSDLEPVRHLAEWIEGLALVQRQLRLEALSGGIEGAE